MTPKEKAIKLFNNYVKLLPFGSNVERAKQCALIAVDEILEAIDWHIYESPNREISFWQEVKQEIENI